MKQRTTNNNKNENMKMRKTLITALVLGACVSMQVFAQNIKQDTITFALTVQQQSSVSTSPTLINAGNWSQSPQYYKTKTLKMTQKDILKSIAYVLHSKNAGYYSAQASLQLVQGELGGFWNIYDSLAQSYKDFSQYFDPNLFLPSPPFTGVILPNELTGSFNDDGTDTTWYDIGTVNLTSPSATYTFLNIIAANAPIFFPGENVAGTLWLFNWQGLYDETQLADPSAPADDLATFLDLNTRTSIADGLDEYARLATGRHFLPVPWLTYDVNDPSLNTTYITTGEYPPGHMQPWGQIYVKDPLAHGHTAADPLCENVTFFFYLSVEECYDCFYLSSFISDATFTTKAGTSGGLPCCTSPSFLMGRGVDRYYLSLSFDNTVNNSYLNPVQITPTAGTFANIPIYFYEFTGYPGLTPTLGVADGTTPDLLPYVDKIQSHLGTPSPYEMRFTLNGIVTYNWLLKMVNASDAAADYVGTATYAANGYGFIGLACSLITGSATFTEKIVKDTGCCDDVTWCMADLNLDDNYTHSTGWYGPGADGYAGYYDPAHDPDQNHPTYFNFYPTDPYPFYNIIAGYSYTGVAMVHGAHPVVVPTGTYAMPDQNESPFNPNAALTQHGILNPSATSH
jgi:hypothetical protein